VPALQYNHTLRFHPVDNDQLIAYSKSVPAAAGDPAGGDAPPADVVLVVVNLDPAHAQSGWVDVDATALGFDAGQPLSAHDLLTDAYFDWRAGRNFVRLDPLAVPAHLLLLEPAGRR
jgi:starch synthase (maltosyl-transferring)